MKKRVYLAHVMEHFTVYPEEELEWKIRNDNFMWGQVEFMLLSTKQEPGALRWTDAERPAELTGFKKFLVSTGLSSSPVRTEIEIYDRMICGCAIVELGENSGGEVKQIRLACRNIMEIIWEENNIYIKYYMVKIQQRGNYCAEYGHYTFRNLENAEQTYKELYNMVRQSHPRMQKK